MTAKRFYVEVPPTRAAVYVCLVKECGEILTKLCDYNAHWTEFHMPKRPRRRSKEKADSRFVNMMGINRGDYKP